MKIFHVSKVSGKKDENNTVHDLIHVHHVT